MSKQHLAHQKNQTEQKGQMDQEEEEIKEEVEIKGKLDLCLHHKKKGKVGKGSGTENTNTLKTIAKIFCSFTAKGWGM